MQAKDISRIIEFISDFNQRYGYEHGSCQVKQACLNKKLITLVRFRCHSCFKKICDECRFSGKARLCCGLFSTGYIWNGNVFFPWDPLGLDLEEALWDLQDIWDLQQRP